MKEDWMVCFLKIVELLLSKEGLIQSISRVNQGYYRGAPRHDKNPDPYADHS